MVNITENKKINFNVKAELCTDLSKIDLQELCDATEEAIWLVVVLVGYHLLL